MARSRSEVPSAGDGLSVEAAPQCLELVVQGRGELVADGGEPLFDQRELGTPLVVVDGERLPDVEVRRRIEAAQKLGIGRNTITRKIQELGLEE